jgi:hypothetical protein
MPEPVRPETQFRGAELFGARARLNVDDSKRRNRTNESCRRKDMGGESMPGSVSGILNARIGLMDSNPNSIPAMRLNTAARQSAQRLHSPPSFHRRPVV